MPAKLIQDVKLEHGEGGIFQQVDDPQHTTYVAMGRILNNAPHQLHSPLSLDLNPIEHLWEELKRRLGKRVIAVTSERMGTNT
ncbi:hypothetical protein Trydic_g2166 [Trypoxylus dichotomus]